MPRTKTFPQSSADTAVDIQKLAAAFAEFRRTHKSGTRIPETLRGEAARALARGISGTQIQKGCGLSWIQVKKLRSSSSAQRAVSLPQPPRVLSVVDERERRPSMSEAIEIGIGPWRLSVTRAA
jgi:hypothetical protein